MIMPALRLPLVSALLLAATPPAHPLRFQQLGTNRYAVAHEEEGPKSLRVAYAKVASICEAAGGKFFQIDRRTDEVLEFTVHAETADGRQECESSADRKLVDKAKKRLEKMAKKVQ
jgi:hypothetical protein